MENELINERSNKIKDTRSKILKDSEAFSGFSVDDIQKAKEFYGQTLGLNVSEVDEMGLISLKLAGGSEVMIYPKSDHAPAQFTILNFPIEDIEKVVADLKTNGVQFEHYEGDLETDEHGIFRGDGPLIAWFKDPAGNIISVLEKDRVVSDAV